MNLLYAQDSVEYIIKNIVTDDEEMDAFLFSLGCYSGEPITVVRRVKGAAWYPSKTADIQSITFWQKPSKYKW